MTSLRLALVPALVLALGGCDGGTTDADAGGADGGAPAGDAGRMDASVPGDDGGTPGDDAGGPGDDGGAPGDDGGTPGVDAGPTPDGGGPGTDGGGVLDGGAAPDGGPPPESCSPPGSVETVACGMCGTVSRFCTAGGTWAYGACEDEGACAPGSTQTVSCGMCGTQTQRCTVDCAWVDMGSCTAEGECSPGETTTTSDGCSSPGELRELTCNASCGWEETAACSADACATPGTLEDVACGLCGTQERFCTSDNVWEYGACMGEGVCMPGTSGSEACGMCGTLATRCTVDCEWVPAPGASCEGEGVCDPGTRRWTDAGCPPGQTRQLECDGTCAYTIETQACMDTRPVDVLFLIDATGSNWFDFSAEADTFVTRCVDAALALSDVQVGLAYYGDFAPSGAPDTFEAAVEIGTGTSMAIATDLSAQTQLGGADDSTMEALHILTGGAAQPGAVEFVCSGGRVAGGCWRPGAERVIVMHTDEFAKGGPDPDSAGLLSPWPSGPDWTTVRPRLVSDGTALLVILDDDVDATGPRQYQEMVTDLGQADTDVFQETIADGIGPECDAVVARVRSIAGL